MKAPNHPKSVIPAYAGIQESAPNSILLAPRVRGDDGGYRFVALLSTRAVACALLAVALIGVPAASKADDERPDVGFALIRYEGGNWNPRPHGLPRLAWEIRKRTSISIDLDTTGVDPSQDALFEYPFLVWQGDQSFPAIPDEAVAKLRQHLTMGGTLLVDVSDGTVDGPFHRAVLRDLRRIFPGQKLARVPSTHVLYKAFYLLDRHGGRVPARAWLSGLVIENRLAVVLTTNDFAGAIARDQFGEWEYDVGIGGNVTREMTFRLGVNMVMYALCLDYKEDQVHIPFILKRRQ